MSNALETRHSDTDRRAAAKEVRSTRAEMLLNISQTMAAYETLDEMLEALVDIITTEVDAERGTIFLHDKETDELYSRVARGNIQREIRILEKSGVAGHVFTSGRGAIVHDAYADKHFDRSIDERTGYVTKSILCAPIKTVRGEVIGVAQALNKRRGRFTEEDLALLIAMTTQAAVALQTIQFVEKIKKSRDQEMEFFKVVSDVISEIELGTVLQKVMSQATKMLNAERSTLFINDDRSNELFSRVGEGLGTEIRLPNHLGIAGTVFTTGQSVNIPHAYADLRFNPAFDRKTGFFTRSILCVPVINKDGRTIGVTQVLNKRGGAFTDEDEFRLRTFTGQISIALENATLFNQIQNMKNYSESMLESMTNGVITVDEGGKIITCNVAGLRIMEVSLGQILDQQAEDFFSGANAWIMEKIRRVQENQESEVMMDKEMDFSGRKKSVNFTFHPLVSADQKDPKDQKHKRLGVMIMMEDISNEKRMKSTMSLYMDAGIADQLMEGGELGGKSSIATVLFSDIRGFTTLTEELGAQGTVSLLNEYFTIMVDCIQREGGMLDKFIGDAIMAGFGIPVAHDDDEDRGLRSAISMITELDKWNVERLSHGKKPINMGIGVNTDNVVTGNIGSPKRMNYTMIGDGVNLASRLESACKQYSARILISEYTYRKLRGIYRVREIDRVVVKGKTEPVAIFEVLDYHTDETFPNLMEVINYFKEGLAHYRQQNWDKAIAAFQESAELNAKDKLAKIYIQRCNYLMEHPPGEDWKGVWVMESK